MPNYVVCTNKSKLYGWRFISVNYSLLIELKLTLQPKRHQGCPLKFVIWRGIQMGLPKSIWKGTYFANWLAHLEDSYIMALSQNICWGLCSKDKESWGQVTTLFARTVDKTGDIIMLIFFLWLVLRHFFLTGMWFPPILIMFKWQLCNWISDYRQGQRERRNDRLNLKTSQFTS